MALLQNLALLSTFAFLLTGIHGRVACDFEGGRLCEGWEQVKTDDHLDWTVWRERSHYKENSTVRNTHYLQMETITHSANQSAVFSTGVLIANSGDVTLSFWFALNGLQVLQLSVKVKDASLEEGFSHKWVKVSSRAQHWTLVRIPLSPSGPFRVIFQGTLEGPEGQIAVDDIEISSAVNLADALWGPDKMNMTSCTANSGSDVTVLGRILRQESPLIAASIGACVFWLGALALLVHCIRRIRKKGTRMRTTATVEVDNGYQLPELPKCPDPPTYCTWPGRGGDVNTPTACQEDKAVSEYMYGGYAVVM